MALSRESERIMVVEVCLAAGVGCTGMSVLEVGDVKK